MKLEVAIVVAKFLTETERRPERMSGDYALQAIIL